MVSRQSPLHRYHEPILDRAGPRHRYASRPMPARVDAANPRDKWVACLVGFAVRFGVRPTGLTIQL